jgi:two-component system, response regulator PdtaR
MQSEPKMAVPAGKQEQRHILVVDDDRLVLASLCEGLRSAGYRVTGSASPAARDTPDLALLDVRMPGMDGIELGRKLREQGGIPFLYLSAYGDQKIVRQAVEEGALGYLVKPLDIQQIVPSIEAALTRSRDLSRLRQSEEHLATALAGNREVSMAIGLLMMRDRMNREQAFETLRGNARAQRRPVVDVAKELLSSAENLYTIKKLEKRSPRRKRSGT